MFLKSKLPEFSPAVVVEPWRKALMDAAEIIRERGWCQHVLRLNSGAVCALGAISTVDSPYATRAWGKLRAYVGGDVVEWNDAFERTAHDVIAAFEGAARS